MDVDDSDESVVDEPHSTVHTYQKDLWQMRLFPYAEEMRRNADEYFSYVKTGLGQAVLHRNSRPGVIFWSQELSRQVLLSSDHVFRFMSLYGRRFSKRDHINMVNLLYEVVVSEKLDFSVVQIVANVLVQLLWFVSKLNAMFRLVGGICSTGRT